MNALDGHAGRAPLVVSRFSCSERESRSVEHACEGKASAVVNFRLKQRLSTNSLYGRCIEPGYHLSPYRRLIPYQVHLKQVITAALTFIYLRETSVGVLDPVGGRLSPKRPAPPHRRSPSYQPRILGLRLAKAGSPVCTGERSCHRLKQAVLHGPSSAPESVHLGRPQRMDCTWRVRPASPRCQAS